QGFTIGGARLQLSGDGAKHDQSQTHQVLRQMRTELEDILHFLKR
ncbi:MAG: MerR family transcriptional regulator, partial [Chromatiaceae bacterium]|nr:MerR family transcriptional regulator [Chromatiaceae bacterium]